MPVKYLVDEDGTVVSEVGLNQKAIVINEGDRLTRRASIQQFEETVKIKNHFIKLNDVVIGMLNKDISPALFLLEYIGYRDGILSFKNGKYIKSIKHFAKVCKCSENTARKVVNTLIKEDIIHKHNEDGIYYTFNPFVCLRGDRASKILYDEFRMSDWKDINTKR